MAELLLELFSEEIPAGLQTKAAQDFKTIFAAKFAASAITYDALECYTTPRRVAIVTHALRIETTSSPEEQRGPRVDAPENAIAGFLKSTGLKLEQLEKRTTPKGDFYFAVKQQIAKPIAEILPDLIQDIISSYNWPKSMKWGNYNIRWVRPLHSILCLFDSQILPVTFGHIKSGNITTGHRFLGNKQFSVTNFNDYSEKLRAHYVILNQEERQKIIHHDITNLANKHGVTIKQDAGLLAEVANLVEWPVALCGNIEQKFMAIPPEALIVTLKSHQRYFSTLQADLKLAPYFITVANMITDDGGAQVINGNERVLRARLEDAKFFWDQDRRNKLDTKIPELRKIIFHAKLGTVFEKTQRIEKLSQFLCNYVPKSDLNSAIRAANLCKCDLATGMVGELPELQGIMGKYYATESGENEAVALAIKEHYSPIGASDSCPTAPTSIIIAISDKIDSMVGLFAINEKPTGSRDPYALRRAAIGAIRIIIENKLRIPLRLLLENAVQNYPASLFDKTDKSKIINDILDFFADRLRVTLKDQNISHDIIAAIFSSTEDDLTKLVDKAKALASFLGSDDGKNLLAAYKRATNIVQIEEKKDNTSYNTAPDPSKLTEAAEKTIFSMFSNLKPMIAANLGSEQFTGAMIHLATLRQPIDEFFSNVKVNNENNDLRKNRLQLLAQFRSCLHEVADFSKLAEG